MKTNTSKQKSFYTQGKQCAARVLLTVWLLVSYSPGNVLAAPDSQLSMAPGASPVEGNLSCQARAGENVCFYYQEGQLRAEVFFRIGAFSRKAVLPVVCSQGEDVESILEVLSRYSSSQRQRQIHVLVCSTLGEVVYVGGLGLKGGGNEASTEDYDEDAPWPKQDEDELGGWDIFGDMDSNVENENDGNADNGGKDDDGKDDDGKDDDGKDDGGKDDGGNADDADEDDGGTDDEEEDE